MEVKKLKEDYENANLELENKKEKLNDLKRLYAELKTEESLPDAFVIYRNQNINLLHEDQKVLDHLISEKKKSIKSIEKEISNVHMVNATHLRILDHNKPLKKHSTQTSETEALAYQKSNKNISIEGVSLTNKFQIAELNKELEKLEREFDKKKSELRQVKSQQIASGKVFNFAVPVLLTSVVILLLLFST